MIFDSFEECKNEKNFINSMYNYCNDIRYTQYVGEFSSNKQRIATALKSLIELSDLQVAA